MGLPHDRRNQLNRVVPNEPAVEQFLADPSEDPEVVPHIDRLYTVGTEVTSDTLNSQVNLASDLETNNRSTNNALEVYTSVRGQRDRNVVEKVCRGWMWKLYCRLTAPLFHAVFEDCPNIDLQRVNPPRITNGGVCNPFNIDVDHSEVDAIRAKIKQERHLFQNTHGDTVTLFRGLTPQRSDQQLDHLKQCAASKGTVSHTSNPLTAWTINPKVAAQYATDGVILERSFNVENIVMVGAFNVLPGNEFVVQTGVHEYDADTIHTYRKAVTEDLWFHRKAAEAIHSL